MGQKLNTHSSPHIRRKRDRKRLEILRSAAAAFRERGFDGTSMEQIAGGLHMTKGSLYYYFKNKQEILYFTQEYSLDRMLALAAKLGKLRERADVKVHLTIYAQLVLMLEELQASAAHIEFHALPPELLHKIVARRDEYEAVLRGFIEDGMKQGIFEKGDPKVLVMAILGAINWTVKWFKPAGPMPVKELAAQFAAYLVRGLVARSKVPKAPDIKLMAEVLQ
jgi:AcrR family transcriptional regulator